MGSLQLGRKEAGELNKIWHKNTLSNSVKAVDVAGAGSFWLVKVDS